MNEEEYDNFRQQLQVEMAQKQALQLQFNEISRTVEEVEKAPENEKLFEMVGQVLVSKNRKELLAALKEKLELIELRLKSTSKSVDETTKKLQEIQKTLNKK